MTVRALCLRVRGGVCCDGTDLPALAWIEMGCNTCQFKEDDTSELVMRSDSR